MQRKKTEVYFSVFIGKLDSRITKDFDFPLVYLEFTTFLIDHALLL